MDVQKKSRSRCVHANRSTVMWAVQRIQLGSHLACMKQAKRFLNNEYYLFVIFIEWKSVTWCVCDECQADVTDTHITTLNFTWMLIILMFSEHNCCTVHSCVSATKHSDYCYFKDMTLWRSTLSFKPECFKKLLKFYTVFFTNKRKGERLGAGKRSFIKRKVSLLWSQQGRAHSEWISTCVMRG